MNDEQFNKALEKQAEVFEKSMTGIEKAIKEINDTNMLHTKTISKLHHSIEKSIVAVENNSKFFRKIIILLVSALIVISGASKALGI